MFIIVLSSVTACVVVHDNNDIDDGKNDGTPEENKGEKAPDFKVTDANGKEIKLSDYIGKPVLLNFWASWCPPCKAEMPDFEAAYKEYGEDVVFLIVNLTDGIYETIGTAKKYISDMGYTFPIVFDTSSEAANAYSVTGIPNTYFIDKDGYIVKYVDQMISAVQLDEGLKLIAK